MIKRDRGEIYGKGKIIPKSITIDNQKQKIETQEVISIGESISFDKKYKVYIDCVREDGTETKVPRWISNTMFRMAPAYGEPGGAGGAGGGANAVSRLNVIDPHLVIMMRDVMDSAETAGRLRVCGSAGGGGGGGAVSSEAAGVTAQRGWTPNAGAGSDVHPNQYDATTDATVKGCIVTAAAKDGGDGGQGGVSYSPTQYYGGAGGGGAGGNGGAVVVITTSASSGTVTLTGGAGADGGSGQGGSAAPDAGDSGGTDLVAATGTAIHIQI